MKNKIWVFVLCIFIFFRGFGQSHLQINGEVVLESADPASVEVVLTDEKKNVLESFTSKTNGTFSAKATLGKNYELVVSKNGFQKEIIHVSTKHLFSGSNKLWPVYVKIKLKKGESNKNYESFIYYDSIQMRFDHKIDNPKYSVSQSVFSGHKVSVDSVGSKKETSEAYSSKKEIYKEEKKLSSEQEEETKFRRETADKEVKSSKQKEILESMKQMEKEADVKRELDILLAKIDRLKTNKIIRSDFAKDYSNEAELEYDNMILKSGEKRRFVEEVSETKKEDKQKQRNYIFD